MLWLLLLLVLLTLPQAVQVGARLCGGRAQVAQSSSV